MAVPLSFREQLISGWTPSGIPTLAAMKRICLWDLPTE
jgi:hypothetical protein